MIGEEKRIEALDYDPVNQILFWADSYDKTIKRSYMVNAQDGQAKIGYSQDLDMKGGSKPTAVAVDWLADNLYWTETDRTSNKRGRDGGQDRWKVSKGHCECRTGVAHVACPGSGEGSYALGRCWNSP